MAQRRILTPSVTLPSYTGRETDPRAIMSGPLNSVQAAGGNPSADDLDRLDSLRERQQQRQRDEQSRAREEQQRAQAAAEKAKAATEKRARNAAQEATLRTQGQDSYTDAFGDIKPLIDPATGQPRTNAMETAPETDPTGKAYQLKRPAGAVEFQQEYLDEKAPVGANPNDPNDRKIYRQNKHTAWEPIDPEQGVFSNDAAVRRASAKSMRDAQLAQLDQEKAALRVDAAKLPTVKRDPFTDEEKAAAARHKEIAVRLAEIEAEKAKQVSLDDLAAEHQKRLGPEKAAAAKAGQLEASRARIAAISSKLDEEMRQLDEEAAGLDRLSTQGVRPDQAGDFAQRRAALDIRLKMWAAKKRKITESAAALESELTPAQPAAATPGAKSEPPVDPKRLSDEITRLNADNDALSEAAAAYQVEAERRKQEATTPGAATAFSEWNAAEFGKLQASAAALKERGKRIQQAYNAEIDSQIAGFADQLTNIGKNAPKPPTIGKIDAPTRAAVAEVFQQARDATKVAEDITTAQKTAQAIDMSASLPVVKLSLAAIGVDFPWFQKITGETAQKLRQTAAQTGAQAVFNRSIQLEGDEQPISRTDIAKQAMEDPQLAQLLVQASKQAEYVRNLEAQQQYSGKPSDAVQPAKETLNIITGQLAGYFKQKAALGKSLADADQRAIPELTALYQNEHPGARNWMQRQKKTQIPILEGFGTSYEEEMDTFNAKKKAILASVPESLREYVEFKSALNRPKSFWENLTGGMRTGLEDKQDQEMLAAPTTFERVPFMGRGMERQRLVQMASIAEKLDKGQPISGWEKDYLKSFILQQERPNSAWSGAGAGGTFSPGAVGGIVGGSVPFAGELVLGGSALGMGEKNVVRAAAGTVAEGVAVGTAELLAKWFTAAGMKKAATLLSGRLLQNTVMPKVALRVLGGTAEGLAYTALNPMMIANKVTELQTPKVQVAFDDRAQIAAFIDPSWTRPSQEDSLRRATIIGAVENISELAGGIGSEFLGRMLRGAGSQMARSLPAGIVAKAARAGAAARKVAKGFKGTVLGRALTNTDNALMQAMRFNGVGGEMLEERIGEAMKLLMLPDQRDEHGMLGAIRNGQFGDAVDQFLLEGLSFAGQGMAMNLPAQAIQGIADRRMAAKNLPDMRALSATLQQSHEQIPDAQILSDIQGLPMEADATQQLATIRGKIDAAQKQEDAKNPTKALQAHRDLIAAYLERQELVQSLAQMEPVQKRVQATAAVQQLAASNAAAEAIAQTAPTAVFAESLGDNHPAVAELAQFDAAIADATNRMGAATTIEEQAQSAGELAQAHKARIGVLQKLAGQRTAKATGIERHQVITELQSVDPQDAAIVTAAIKLHTHGLAAMDTADLTALGIQNDGKTAADTPDGLPRVVFAPQGEPIFTQSFLKRIAQISPAAAKLLPVSELAQRALFGAPAAKSAKSPAQQAPVTQAQAPAQQAPGSAPAQTEWDVTIEGQSAPVRITARNEAEALTQGARMNKGMVTDVSPVQPASSAPTPAAQPAPVAQPVSSAGLEQLAGTIAQNRGEPLADKHRAVATQIVESTERWRAAFADVQYEQSAPGEGDGMQITKDGVLLIDLEKIAKKFDKRGDKWIANAIHEEMIHAVALRLEADGAFDAKAIFLALPKSIQDMVSAAYVDTQDPWSLGHEFLRMLIQGRISETALTEAANPSLLKKIGKALAAIARFFRDLAGELRRSGANQQTIDAVTSVVTLIESRIDQLDAAKPPATPAAQPNAPNEEIQGQGKREAPLLTPAPEATPPGNASPTEIESALIAEFQKVTGRRVSVRGDNIVIEAKSGAKSPRTLTRKAGIAMMRRSLASKKAPRSGQWRLPKNRSGIDDAIDYFQAEIGNISNVGRQRKKTGEGEALKTLQQRSLHLYSTLVQPTGQDIDTAAQQLHDKFPGVFREATPENLVETLLQSYDERRKTTKDNDALEWSAQWGRNPAEYEDAMAEERKAVQQDQAFEDANQPWDGSTNLKAGQLAIGDYIKINGHDLEVVEITPEGEIVLEDGDAFGTQVVDAQKELHLDDAPLEEGFRPKQIAPQTPPPATKDKGPLPEDFLAGTPDDPFNLVAETAKDIAERQAREAREAAAKAAEQERKRKEQQERDQRNLFEDTPGEPVAPPPAPPVEKAPEPAPQKLSPGLAKLKGLLDKKSGLGTQAGEATYDSELTPDEIGDFVEVARVLIGEGITTPEALAEGLTTIGYRQYSEAIWSAFGMIGKQYRSLPDWGRIYAAMNPPADLAPEKDFNQSALHLATELKERIKSRQTTSLQELTRLAEKHFGGKTGAAFDIKDAYDAVEMAINLLVQESQLDVNAKPPQALDAIQQIREWLKYIPTQTRRTDEMVNLQQFSTPPHFSYVANWVANLRDADVALEPSGGLGGLAAFSAKKAATVYLNELSGRRRGMLDTLRIGPPATGHDAGKLHAILLPSIQSGKMKQPTVVVMNPPFSNNAAGRKDLLTGAEHIEEMLKLLPDGGRLIAIVGEGMALDAPRYKPWWDRIRNTYSVRANVHVDGREYMKYGTTFSNRLLVIDKASQESEAPIVGGNVTTIEELIPLLNNVRTTRPNGYTQKSPTQPRRPQTDGERGDDAPAMDSADTGPGIPSANNRGRPVRQPRSPGAASATGRNGRRGAKATERSDDARGDDGRAAGGRSTEDFSGAEGNQLERDTADVADLEIDPAEVFTPYSPRRLRIKGAQPHPSPLVESSSMASIMPPPLKIVPNLPEKAITSGALSDAQLETIAYAIQAHERVFEDGVRQGYFVGDGTGVGKGREIAGVIAHNWREGRRKAIWISEKKDLAKDAQRDLNGIGTPVPVWNMATSIAAPEGDAVAFLTYDGLKSNFAGLDENGKVQKPQPSKPSRMENLINWLGKDFDGVIALDEVHNAGNALAIKGARGVTQPSQGALRTVDLQRAFPKARILYVSATGATEPQNIAFAERLGLWGPGRAFANVVKFYESIKGAGLSAMEIFARDLKSIGLYAARQLSFNGVGFERIEHQATPEQIAIYEKAAEGWQKIFANLNAALGASKAEKNRYTRDAATGQFWGSQQRFFNNLLTSMQMPTVLRDMRKRLADGGSVVIQLVGTNEAALERAIDLAMEENPDNPDLQNLDMSNRQDILDYLAKSFPTNQFHEVPDGVDSNNRPRPKWVPLTIKDENGKETIVQNPEAVAMRDKLLQEIALLRLPDPPIEQILNAFGADAVAEITGRKRRLVTRADESGVQRRIIETGRGDANLQVEKDEFLEGKRRVLIFSNKGGTGFSYHAGKTFKNQQRRYQYVVQAGWRADKAIQGLGRTHRADQVMPPHFVLVSTNVRGHQRFISTIARRLQQLGALTSGERKSTGQGLFNDSDNVEDDYGESAVTKLFRDLYHSRIPNLSFGEVSKQLGFVSEQDGETRNDLTDSRTGGLVEEQIPDIRKFLNRVLAMPIDAQNELYDAFLERRDAFIQAAKELGSYDIGVETFKPPNLEIINEETVLEDKEAGTKTRLVDVKYRNYFNLRTFDDVRDKSVFTRNRRTGKVFAYEKAADMTREDGAVVGALWQSGVRSFEKVEASVAETAGKMPGYAKIGAEFAFGDTRYRLVAVTEGEDPQAKVARVINGEESAPINAQGYMLEALYNQTGNVVKGVNENANYLPAHYKLTPEQAEAAWDDEFTKQPKYEELEKTFIAGTIIPIWHRIPPFHKKVQRVIPETGPAFLGVWVPPASVEKTKRLLGASAGALTPRGLISAVLDRKAIVTLSNGWIVKFAKSAGENRIEVVGPDQGIYSAGAWKAAYNGFIETINFRPRYFLHADEKGIDALLRTAPSIDVQEPGGGGLGTQSGENAEMDQFRRDALATARAMAAEGKSSEEIRALTGWFPGKYDGKMRWEIPDKGAAFEFPADAIEEPREDWTQTNSATFYLGDVFVHPALFAAYPEARGIKLTIYPTLGANGQFEEFDGKGFISLRQEPPWMAANRTRRFLQKAREEIDADAEAAFKDGTAESVEEAKARLEQENARDQAVLDSRQIYSDSVVSTLLHEIQHWIQRKEGFAKGGNSDAMRKMFDFVGLAVNRANLAKALRAAADLQDKLGEFSNETVSALPEAQINVAFGAYNVTEERWMSSAELRQEAQRLDEENINTDLTGYEAYRRLAGEIEARDVQARMNFTPEQRAAVAPYSSENIAPEDATLRTQSGENAEKDYADAIEQNNAEAAARIVQGRLEAIIKAFPVSDNVEHIPNASSVAASLTDYATLGVRDVPIEMLLDLENPQYPTYFIGGRQKAEALAESIADEGLRSPLILVWENDIYPYVLEGTNRYDALRVLAVTNREALPASVPALAVIDKSAKPFAYDDNGNQLPLSRLLPAPNGALRTQSGNTNFERLLRDNGVDIDALDAMTDTASQEQSGERTIGRPDLAFGAGIDSPADPIIMAIDQIREITPETMEEWNAAARSLVEGDYDGAMRHVVVHGLELGTQQLDPVWTRVAQILVERESRLPQTPERVRLLQALVWTYRLSGTLQARGLASRRDPFKSPAQRNREFLVRSIMTPPAETREQIEKATTAAERTKLLRKDQERIQKIQRALARMGVTLDDIFNGEVALRLKNSKFVARNIESMPPQQRKAVALAQGAERSFAEIAKATGLTVEQVQAAKAEAMAKIRADLLARVEAARQAKALSAQSGDMTEVDFAALAELSPDDLNRELDTILKQMGFFHDAHQGKRTTVKRKPEKVFSPPAKPRALTPEQLEKLERYIKAPLGKPTTGTQLKLWVDAPAEVSILKGTDLADPEQAVKVLRVTQSATGRPLDMLVEFWINNILSGPATQAANITGNIAAGAWEFTVQRGMESMLNLLFRRKDGAQIGELWHIIKAITPGMSRGLRLMVKAWNTEQDWLQHDVINRQIDLFETGPKGEGYAPAIPGLAGRIIRIPGRGLIAMDGFFKGLYATMEAAAQAYRIAKSEGLKGAALQGRMSELVNIPGSQAWQLAVQKAKEATFQEDLPEVVQAFQRFANSHRLLKFAFPFIRTPYNIFRVGIRKSPIGAFNLLAQLVRHGLAKMGADVRTESAPKMIGLLAEQVLSLAGLALLLGAVEGDDDDDKKAFLITGSPPKNEGQRALQERSLGGSYVLRIGGHSFNYGRIEPIATVLGTMADTLRSVKSGATPSEKLSAPFDSIRAQSLNKTFLKGLADILESIERPGSLGSKFRDFAMKALVPNIIRQPVRATDPDNREYRTAEWWFAALPMPGAEPRVDPATGEDQKKGGNAATRLLMPSATPRSPSKADAVLRIWNQRHPDKAYAPAPPSQIITYEPKRADAPAVRVTLNAKAYRFYQQRAAALANSALASETLVPSEDGIERIRRIFEEARSRVRRELQSRPIEALGEVVK